MRKKEAVRYPFTRQLMFAKVMEDPTLCKEFIQRLFSDRPVKDVVFREVVTVTTEATLIPGIFSKYIRLDVLFEDDFCWYNVEMQVAGEDDLAKRARYYSSVIDVTHLEKAEPYGNLKPSFVIFLCSFDYYGKNEAIYSFERFDKKLQLPCGDESFIIILNTICPSEKVPEELRSLFNYINTEDVAPGDWFVEMIHDRVLKFQSDEEVAFNMTLEEEYLRKCTLAAQKGIAKGMEEGIAKGMEEGLAKGREEGLAKGREEGLAKGMEEGIAKGREEERERINALNERLLEAGRIDDIRKSLQDSGFQQQLLEEFGL